LTEIMPNEVDDASGDDPGIVHAGSIVADRYTARPQFRAKQRDRIE